MAGNEISARIKVDGGDEAIKALQNVGKEAKKIDGTTAEAKVKADTKAAEKGLKEVSGDLKKVDGQTATAKVEADTGPVKRDLTDVFDVVEKLGSTSARIILQDNAASIKSEIADLVLRLDGLEDPQHIRITMDQINELEGQLGTIEGKLNELGGREIDIRTGSAKGAIDDLGNSADKSKSVLANMVGNATQDLGALGGVAGSAGVAIGQMGEYMADAAAGGTKLGTMLKNFAFVAGPIAAIAVGTQLLGSHMKKVAESKAFDDKRVKDFAGALDDAKISAQELQDVLAADKDTGIFVNIDREAKNVEESVARTMGTFQTFFAEVQRGGRGDPVLQEYADNLRASADAAGMSRTEEVSLERAIKAAMDGRISGKSAIDAEISGHKDEILTLVALAAAINGEAEGAVDAAFMRKFYGEALDDTTDKTEDSTAATEENAAAAEEAAAGWKTFADGIAAYAIKVKQAQGALDTMAGAFDEMGGRQDALKAVFDLGNAPEIAAGKTRDIAIAIGELDTALEGVDVGAALAGDVSADKFLDAIDAIAPDIQSKVIDAFSTGGPEAATAMANSYIDQVTAELGGRFTREQVAQLLGIEDIEVRAQVALELDEKSKAMTQLGILKELTGEDTFTADVELALQAGTITGEQAQTLIQQRLGDEGVRVPGTLQTLQTDEAIAEAEAALAAGQLVATVQTVADTLTAEGDLAELTDAERLATIAAVADTIEAAGDLTTLTDAERTALINSIAETLQANTDLDETAAKERAAKILASAEVRQAETDINHAARPRTVRLTAVIGGKGLAGAFSENFARGGKVPPSGGIAGEAGPEYVRMPDGRIVLLTGPSFVPPRAQVTSTSKTRRMLQKRGPGGLPMYANGTTDPIGMVWEQILRQLNQLNAATVAGNDTTEDVARLLAAADVDKMDADQGQKMLELLGRMTNEMQRGDKANIEALDNLEAELSATIGSSVFDGIVRFEDGTLGPGAALEPATPTEVVAKLEQKTDPNTAILEKIALTLQDMLSHDRTSAGMVIGELGSLHTAIYMLQAPGDIAPMIRGASMAITAGRA